MYISWDILYAHCSVVQCFVVVCYKFQVDYGYLHGLMHCQWGNHMIASVAVHQPMKVPIIHLELVTNQTIKDIDKYNFYLTTCKINNARNMSIILGMYCSKINFECDCLVEFKFAHVSVGKKSRYHTLYVTPWHSYYTCARQQINSVLPVTYGYK